MNIDEDTSDWLGCPSPLEMYKHQCALLEDEIADLYAKLRNARINVTGLIQMNDELSVAKAEVEGSLRAAVAEVESLKQACSEPGVLGMKLVVEQRDYLFRENQRLLLEKGASVTGTP